MRNGIQQHCAFRFPRVSALLTLANALTLASPAVAQPVPGSLESFPGASLDGWASGDLITNPGAGGVLGPGDGYLLLAVDGLFPVNLGAFAKTPAYAGDWIAAGITQVQLWLDDVNQQDTLEIHFALGDGLGGNFWQCNTGFVPPHNQWAPFVVDLTETGNFSPIGSASGTFASALQTVDRILVRHDKAPFMKAPDTVIGDMGLDEVLLIGGTSGIAGSGAPVRGGPVRLSPPVPNPSRGALSLHLETADAAPVLIQIVDVMGRVIRHGELPAAPPGAQTWTWDGSDDRGFVAPAGYYRVRAIGPSGGTSQPLVRVR